MFVSVLDYQWCKISMTDDRENHLSSNRKSADIPFWDDIRQFVFESCCPGGGLFTCLLGSSVFLIFKLGFWELIPWLPLLFWLVILVTLEFSGNSRPAVSATDKQNPTELKAAIRALDESLPRDFTRARKAPWSEEYSWFYCLYDDGEECFDVAILKLASAIGLAERNGVAIPATVWDELFRIATILGVEEDAMDHRNGEV